MCKMTLTQVLFPADIKYFNFAPKDDDNRDEIGGIAGLILECIRSCNSDVRPLVVQNILCVGGGSMVPGTTNIFH